MASKTYANFDIEMNDPEKKHSHMNIQVRHADGGVSYLDYKTRKRGLKVSVRPMTIEKTEYGTSRSFMLFGDKDDMAFHVTTLARQTHKKGRALAAFVSEHKDAIDAAARIRDWDTIMALLATFEYSDTALLAA